MWLKKLSRVVLWQQHELVFEKPKRNFLEYLLDGAYYFNPVC
jgi:hypothetical protein